MKVLFAMLLSFLGSLFTFVTLAIGLVLGICITDSKSDSWRPHESYYSGKGRYSYK